MGLGLHLGLGALPAGALALGVLSVAAPIQTVRAAPNTDKYVLGPGDVLRVVVQGYSEFNQDSVTVPPDGTVTLPHFGTIKISGKTRLQLQGQLAGALKKNEGMRRPLVAVAITTFRSGILGNVVLSGDVPRPGSIELREGQRLSDVLANAGLQERLDEKSATLLRGGKATKLNLQSAMRAPRGAFDVALRPGDVITVKSIAPGRVRISGAVASQGAYELHREPRPKSNELGLKPRLSELIREAGGLSGGATSEGATGATETGAGDLVGGGKPRYTAFLQRSGARIPLDPEAALANSEGPADLTLLPGDVVTIQTVQPLTVYIEGPRAKNTGEFKVMPGTELLQLLTTAGGLTAPADEVVGSVRRGAQIIPVDLSALMLSGDSESNLTLQEGDYVQLRAPESLSVSVFGSVKEAGRVDVKPGSTVLEALLDAGGLSVPSNEARVNLLRKLPDGGQKVMPINAVGVTTFSDVSTNYVLQNGDSINVTPVAKQSVVISGQVNNPGSYELRQGEGLAELITRAGGAQDDAKLTEISITRAGQQKRADAYDALKKGEPLEFDLADGDFVVVPQNKDRVLVMEGVQKAGYYAIPERGQLTLLEALGQAQPMPNTKKVSIYRAREDGTVDRGQKPQELKLDEVRRGTKGTIVLQPRDIVFVESPKNKRSFLEYLPLVGFLFR